VSTGTRRPTETASPRLAAGADPPEAASGRKDALGVLAVVAAVVAVNLPYLLGVVHFDPALLYSGLGEGVRNWVLPGSPQIEPNLGITAQALGHRSALDLLSGKVPWWNPFEGIGAPLAGEMQAASLFPPVLLLALRDGQLPFHMLLELVAGISTLALLRQLRVRPSVAAASGIGFALSGTFAWLRNAAENPVAFLPLALVGVELARSATEDGRRGGWALLGLAIALAALAGFPETAYLEGLFVLVWAVARLPALEGARRRARFLAKVAGGGLAGIALAAPLLVAFVDYLRHAYIGGHAGAFGAVHLPTAASATLGFPWLFGPVFANVSSSSGAGQTLRAIWGNVGGYLAPAVVVLALGGLLFTRGHKLLRVLLGLWCLVFLGRTFGVVVLTRVANAIPGGHDVAIYRYVPPTWELAAVVLGALFLEELASGQIGLGRSMGALAAGTAGLAAAGLAGSSVSRSILHAPDERQFVVGSLSAAGVVLAACLVAFVVAGSTTRGRTKAATALAVLLGVEALAFFGTTTLSAPRQGRLDLAPVRYLKAHLGTARFFTLGPLQPDYGSYFGLSELDVNDLPVPKAWVHLVLDQLDTNAGPTAFNGEFEASATGPSPVAELDQHLATYEALGVRYVLSPAGTRPLGSLQPVFRSATTWIYRLPTSTPLLSSSGGTCTIDARSEERFVVDCPLGATLVYHELRMPGWSATVDAKHVPLEPSGRLFSAVDVPAGKSTVRFRFVPPREDLAALAALAGALVLLAGAAMGVADRRGGGRRLERRLAALEGRSELVTTQEHPLLVPGRTSE